MKKLAFALALMGIAPPIAAQQTAGPGEPRIRQIIIYGNDPCPPSSDEEVVVCGRRPETERLRIPEELRETPPDPENESWAERARSLETVGRTGTMSCSTVGPGGFTGCWQQMMDQARGERRAAAANPQVP